MFFMLMGLQYEWHWVKGQRKLASLAQEICTLWFPFFVAVLASKGYPFKNIFDLHNLFTLIVLLGYYISRENNDFGFISLIEINFSIFSS